MPDRSFRALGVSEPIVRTLADRSIHTPFRIQTLVLPDALAGLDVAAQSPTGSGKTLAFALPIVERTDPADKRPSAVVLVPTRELALQVSDELRSLAAPRGLEVVTVYGGAPLAAQAKRAGRAHVIVATPGRLQDLVDRRAVSLSHVRILVLDEADRMLDMGFKPQVDRLVKRMPNARQTMLFSATLAGRVDELIGSYTANAVRVEAGAAPGKPAEVGHRFVSVKQDTKVDTLVKELGAADDLTLVFVRTKRGADRLARALSRRGIPAGALHGDMSQSAREKSLARFESGQFAALVATDVAARGLDLDRITHVINYDPPAEHTSYVHRTGRTGRAGRSGKAITFVLPDQQAETSHVARRLGHGERFEEAGLRSARPKLVYSGRRRRGSKW